MEEEGLQRSGAWLGLSTEGRWTMSIFLRATKRQTTRLTERNKFKIQEKTEYGSSRSEAGVLGGEFPWGVCVCVCVCVWRGQSHMYIEVSAPVWRQWCMQFKAATSCYFEITFDNLSVSPLRSDEFLVCWLRDADSRSQPRVHGGSPG
ncbi:hypothetical protein AN642_01245 [Epulopiscium sp. SCG-B10WGA-EpuloA2]|nr:hypothetical protein AN642_01245 [Epulopiscium sp. SCG-B10WGA-EpuloA2]